MRKIILLLALMTATVCHAQSKSLFGKIPEFLATASDKEMSEVFQSQIFARFSATLPEGVIVAYENTSRVKEGSIEEIKDQISMFKNKLEAAKHEIPEVDLFQWADYKERTEVYPCGLVAVFHNNQISHVWLDLK
jgi:hypothetical protein